jgi:O-antigen ligase
MSLLPNFRGTARLDHAARLLTLALPFLALTTRAGAEIGFSVLAALFLLHAAVTRDFAWTRTPFFIFGTLWWGWTVLAAIIEHGKLGHALALIREPLAVMALGAWVLREERWQKRLWHCLAAVLCWIILQCWQQIIFGVNWFGQGPHGDGALTGPFLEPRAGPAIVLLAFPIVVPFVIQRISQPGWLTRATGIAAMIGLVATMVLVGQRMPLLLTILGLTITACLLSRLRLVVFTAIALGGVLLAATPVIAPATYHKLVMRFEEQAGHFQSSSYGQLYQHGAELVTASPIFGIGYDKFRDTCKGPVYGSYTAANDLVYSCNTHPHNFYIEAAVNGGLPAAFFFAGMAAVTLWHLRPRRNARTALDAGVFAGALVLFWPIASTSSFVSFPNLGWGMLVMGLGFAIHGHLGARPLPLPMPVPMPVIE